ncbi:pyridoxal phosphate-dependent aminotransferase [Haemophilus haemolyticus]|uniref:pyridoxal phosphate-dependent aminotransferase n=1 Tax=Haemophilus haemolyticus TaxID=726 RepID=UPI000E582F52|nr:pyridoxal phosphate-dependent aminotransferase [Haemophilus haemolyticus]
MKLSKLAENIKFSAIPKINQIARKFDHVEYYTMGEPSLPSPTNVKNSVIQAILNDDTFYSENQGNIELRNLISKNYNEQYYTQFTNKNVMITYGSTGALYLTLLTLISPNDEVILLTPHYSNYIGQIKNINAKPILANLNNDFSVNIDNIEKSITPKSKALLLNSPSNPIGKVFNKEDIIKIGKLAKKYNLFIISDEIYSELVFEKNHHSFITPEQENFDNTFVINGFSKSYSMTGYRIGFISSPNTYALQIMSELDDQIYGGIPNFIQKGAITALKEPQYSSLIKQTYLQRRNQLYQGIKKIKNLDCILPEAAFYAFVNIKKTGLTSEEFVYKLMEEKQIAVVPGTNYGEAGEGFIRISYVTTEEKINYLLESLNDFIQKL